MFVMMYCRVKRSAGRARVGGGERREGGSCGE